MQETQYRTRIRRLLGRNDKHVDSAKDPLCTLWRLILLDLNIGFEQWINLMVAYLTDKRNGVADNVEARSNARGNLTKSLTGRTMTIMVFLRGLKFLQVDSARFTVEVMRHGKESSHQAEVQFRDRVRDRVKEPVLEDAVPRSRLALLKAKRSRPATTASYSSDPLSRLLNDERKEIYKASDVLSTLWRQMLMDLNIGITGWNASMLTYLDKHVAPAETPTETAKKRSNLRGNMNKELVLPKMTIKVFLKGMDFLQVTELKLTVMLRRRNQKKATLHSVKVTL